MTGRKKLHKTVSPHEAIAPAHEPKKGEANPAIQDGNTMKKTRVYPKIDEKHAAFAALVKGGVDKVKAAEVLGYKPKKAYDLARRVEKKGHKLDVASESMVRLSHRAIKNCLKGKPWGAIETIKDSTALAAAQVVVDRHQPKNAEPNEPTYSFTEINLNLVKPGHPDYIGITESPPIEGDIEPITEDEKCDKDEKS